MQKKTAVIIISVLCVAVSVLAVLSGWLYAAYESPEERAAKDKVLALSSDLADLSDDLNEAGDQIAAHVASIESLEAQIRDLNSDVSAKMAEIRKLEKDIEQLLEEGASSDAYQQILLERLTALRSELENTLLQIETLNLLVENYKNITTLDFGLQAQKISDLLLFLAQDNRPMHINRTEIIDEESGEVIDTVTEEVPSNISFYYRDIATGYTLSYNAEDVMLSASVVKAPYIYILLKNVYEFEQRKLNFDSEGNPLYDEDGKPLFEGDHPNLDKEGRIIYAEGEEKYDLSRAWTFDKETMMIEGTGVICNMEDGTKLTYLELIEYVLKYSDNIAFNEISSLFGYYDYYMGARALGVNAISNGFLKLSAEECGIFLMAIYDFMETNEKYGPIMKQAMIDSNYPVLIPYCVSPTPVAHKYGWDVDAYNDMGIVYDEYPYILVIMTDLDTGGTTVNRYVQSVVRMIHSIHETFYEGAPWPPIEIETEPETEAETEAETEIETDTDADTEAETEIETETESETEAETETEPETEPDTESETTETTE
ncbi:MAG: serine hydrolase [Clostridia bacterium]|nr:serine hydrolase [Clostridia bacterium]